MYLRTWTHQVRVAYAVKIAQRFDYGLENLHEESGQHVYLGLDPEL